MKNFYRLMARFAITALLFCVAVVLLFRLWAFYTESPWTRDAKFAADVVSIAPDVSGLISSVPIKDNQLVRKGDVLMVIDKLRYQQALVEEEADVSYYQALVMEKQREAARRVKLGATQSMSQEIIDQSNNSLQTVQQQLSKAMAVRDLAKLDLVRTSVLAPADGWITNLTVHEGEFINRGATAVALVKKGSLYIVAYMEETKLAEIKLGDRVQISPLGSDVILRGSVDSIAAGVTNTSSSVDSKGLANIDSNLEWVRLAQRVPVKIMLDEKYRQQHYTAGTTATIMVTGNQDVKANTASFFTRMLHRLHEFG